MPVTVKQANVYFCKCAKCGYEWDTLALPKRCAGATCKTTAWKGEETSGQSVADSTPVKEEEKPVEFPKIVNTVREAVEKAPRPKKVAKASSPKAGKLSRCPHGFFIVEGNTSCPTCSL